MAAWGGDRMADHGACTRPKQQQQQQQAGQQHFQAQ